MRRQTWVMVCILMLVLGGACLPALAAPLSPTSYDMLNGEYGSWNYVDSIYPLSPNNVTALGPLTGGTGYLTDGTVNTGHWYQVAGVGYLGWYTIDPAITFHFPGTVNVNQVGIHVDNTYGYGDVRYPASVAIQMGAVADNFTITADPNYSINWFYFNTTGLSGNNLTLTLNRDGAGRWIMLDEVSFNGTPVPLPRDSQTPSSDPRRSIGGQSAGMVGVSPMAAQLRLDCPTHTIGSTFEVVGSSRM